MSERKQPKIIENRYDFVVLFTAENSNPNGDPDAGNAPRVDPETGCGYVTDVCLKRKIRNYVDVYSEFAMENEKDEGKEYNILVKPEKTLNSQFAQAYAANELKLGQKGANVTDVQIARQYMCDNYYDIRAFGAVMSTGEDPCGIVRGPVQINFAKSISPVVIHDVTITRQAKTTDDRKAKGDTEMGRKSVIPFGLYRAEGYISAAQAQRVTHLSENDVELLWKAIANMFEDDHSAARGKMAVRKLFVFKHDSVLGECPSYELFDKIKITEKQPGKPPRSFDDYIVEVDRNLPDGVELIEKV